MKLESLREPPHGLVLIGRLLKWSEAVGGAPDEAWTTPRLIYFNGSSAPVRVGHRRRTRASDRMWRERELCHVTSHDITVMSLWRHDLKFVLWFNRKRLIGWRPVLSCIRVQEGFEPVTCVCSLKSERRDRSEGAAVVSSVNKPTLCSCLFMSAACWTGTIDLRRFIHVTSLWLNSAALILKGSELCVRWWWPRPGSTLHNLVFSFRL